MAEKTINYIKLPDGETYRVGGGSGFNLFDTKISDHVLEGEEALGWELQGTYVYKEGVAGSRTGYADFYNKCLAEKELGTATETTLGDNTITMYINGNGHKFYDIADKTVVDNWYNTYGIADYYGVDTENERIFLPRDKYFAVTGGVKGNGKALGLTDGNTDYYLRNGTVGTSNSAVLTPGTSSTLGDGSSSVSLSANKGIGIVEDSTKSGITLEPNENKYLYICVGNTKVESAISNVTEITTSENDTLPLFHNFYSKEDMTTTGAYVNASLGSYLSGNVYATAYNELVKKLGTGNVKANTDTYTDYDFVVNQDEMSFRLPLKNGQEIMFATGVKGNGTTIGLTDGTKNAGMIFATSSADLKPRENAYGLPIGSSYTDSSFGSSNITMGLTTDSTKSGIVIDTENITIPDGWNLYYKVANAVTNLELLDVAKVTADLNTKISRTECPSYVVETYQNGESWYRVYSDGWCEQGGSLISNTNVLVELLKPYKDTNFTVVAGGGVNGGNWPYCYINNNASIYVGTRGTAGYSGKTAFWKTCGYIA